MTYKALKKEGYMMRNDRAKVRLENGRAMRMLWRFVGPKWWQLEWTVVREEHSRLQS